MFRLTKSLITLCAVGTLWSPGARAATIVSEDFSYAPGAITGDNGGSGWDGPWTSSSATTPDQVTTQGWTYSSGGNTLDTPGGTLMTVGSDVGAYRRPPTAFGAYGGDVNQDVWISFLARNTPDGTTAGGYGGLSLYQKTNNDSGAETEQFFLGALTDPNSGNEVYGFANSSASAAHDAANAPFVTATAADTQTHFLVAEFQFTATGSTEATLYVDPTPGVAVDDGTGSDNLVPTLDPALDYVYSDSFQFDQFRLQSGSGTGTGSGAFDFGDLRMGNSYLDVAPLASAAPEPGGGPVLLVLAGLLGGRLALARRRRLADTGRVS